MENIILNSACNRGPQHQLCSSSSSASPQFLPHTKNNGDEMKHSSIPSSRKCYSTQEHRQHFEKGKGGINNTSTFRDIESCEGRTLISQVSIVTGKWDADPFTNKTRVTTDADEIFRNEKLSVCMVTSHAQIESSPILNIGIENLGNTCYLNSALQMIMSAEEFVEDIIESKIKGAKSKNEVEVKTSLRDALINFFLSMKSSDTNVRSLKIKTTPPQISLNTHVSNPVNLKNVVDEHTEQFKGFRQQDSHEFLSSLLDLLHEELTRVAVNNSRSYDTHQADENSKKEVLHYRDSGCGDREKDHINENPICEDTKPPKLNSQPSVVANKGGMTTFHTEDRKGCSYKSNSKCYGRLVGGRCATPLLLTSRKGSRKGYERRIGLFPTKVENSQIESMMKPNVHVCEANMLQKVHPIQDSSVLLNVLKTKDFCARRTPVDYHFTTEIKIQLTCDHCKYTRSHLEVFRYLSIEVGSSINSSKIGTPTSNLTVQEGLRSFLSSEKREVKCEKCFSGTATQTMKITRLPRSLILHLKRFVADLSSDFTRIIYRKNSATVSFGEELPMENGAFDDYLADDVEFPPLKKNFSLNVEHDSNVTRKYKLTSIVNHIGSSASCGHYTADGLRVSREGGMREWTRFNDSKVTQISTEEAMGLSSQKTAYLVMYELE